MNGPLTFVIPFAEAMLAALSLAVFLVLLFIWACGQCAGMALGWSRSSVDQGLPVLSVERWVARL